MAAQLFQFQNPQPLFNPQVVFPMNSPFKFKFSTFHWKPQPTQHNWQPPMPVCPIKAPNHVNTLKKFNLHAAKQDGISSGGEYRDESDHHWMIKEPQWGDYTNGVKEYVAGGVYQKLMGDYAPTTVLIVDEQGASLKVGSKYLNNFSTLVDNGAFGSYFNSAEHMPDTYMGKPIKNMANLLASVIFMGDTDAHQGNVGLVEETGAFMLSKIDHGFAFADSGDIDISRFKGQIHMYGDFGIQEVGFENIYEAINMVVNIPVDELCALVKEKVQDAREYIQLTQSHSADLRVNMLERDMLSHVQTKHDSFKKILLDLKIDDIIHRDDVGSLEQMIEQGLDVNKGIKPFFDNSPSFPKSRTPLNLAKLYDAPVCTQKLEDLNALDASLYVNMEHHLFDNQIPEIALI